ncbi:MAG: ATP-binding protein [Thermoguttaceae bacterium]|nr:ATP-binding protein [Thermoguttaceae bacterium]
MIIQRDRYLQKLIRRRENGMVKVITGIRRCGKSYLLFELYRQYLNADGVADDHIIELALDEDQNARYRNPVELGQYIRSLLADKSKTYYVFLDEIQKVVDIPNPYLPGTTEKIGFVDVLLGLMKIKNVDLYVTGSNSKMLSTDILTEFRGRGDEVRVNPLSYQEFYAAYGEDKRNAWRDYFTFGGMPLTLAQKTSEDKSRYLHTLFDKIYLDDIMSRHNIANKKTILDDLLDIVSSSVGSLTNPSKIQKTFASVKGIAIAVDSISRYLDYFIDAFLLYQAKRYDVKGRRYVGSPLKYYFSDVGLRNARLNFRQQEENHIMENLIYNELRAREFDVDVGIVTVYSRNEEGKSKRTQNEVDFVANRGSQRYYIQSAFAIPDEQKRAQETASLTGIGDSFRKIVVVRENIAPWHDENGVLYVGVEDFLLNDRAMDL